MTKLSKKVVRSSSEVGRVIRRETRTMVNEYEYVLKNLAKGWSLEDIREGVDDGSLTVCFDCRAVKDEDEKVVAELMDEEVADEDDDTEEEVSVEIEEE